MQRWTISSTDRKGEDTRRTSLSSSSARMKRAAPPIVQTVPIRLSAISRLNTSRLALVRSSDSRNFLMPAAFSAMRWGEGGFVLGRPWWASLQGGLTPGRCRSWGQCRWRSLLLLQPELVSAACRTLFS